MTAICIPVFIKPGINLEETLEEIEDVLDDAAEAGVRGMVELRCDTATPRMMLEAMEIVHAPTIVTVRPTWEGGHCEKDDEYRIGLWEQAIEAGVEYIDVELLAWEKNRNVRERVCEAAEKSGTRIILSNHSFDGPPKDLQQRVDRMKRIKQADVLKIAYKADSILDAINALNLTARLNKEDRRPNLVLAMGEEGLISRILANKFGAAWTFAIVEAGAETAPGQPTIHDLIHKYRWAKQKPTSPVFGVAGWPVGHSKSPQMHNAGFDAVGTDGVYVPLAIKPDQFPTVVDALRNSPAMNFRGMSVTIPHKEAAFKYVCDKNGKIDDLSWRIGVLNTMVFDGPPPPAIFAASTPITKAPSTPSLPRGMAHANRLPANASRSWVRAEQPAPSSRVSPTMVPRQSSTTVPRKKRKHLLKISARGRTAA